MRLKFHLLFDGDEQALAASEFPVGADGATLRFKSEELIEAEVLRDTLSAEKFEEVMSYFSFPGFLLYFLEAEGILYFILYREYQQRHQLYERGYLKL